jgi:hypothetical protein
VRFGPRLLALVGELDVVLGLAEVRRETDGRAGTDAKRTNGDLLSRNGHDFLTISLHPAGNPTGRFQMKPKTNKRGDRRMIRQQSAWITLNGVVTTECQIMDLSKRGAKIVPDGSSVVPSRFELAFTLGDQKRQPCEVIWRRGRMLGIKFVA